MMSEQKILTRTDGYITVDIPPVKIPTLSTAAGWLVSSRAVRYLMLLLMGVWLGNSWHSGTLIPTIPPIQITPPVVPKTETLDEFVTRESHSLTADERQKLIAVAEKVLTGFYDQPYQIREAFREERLKAGIDSEAFKTFSEKWSAKVTDMKIEENVESMRHVYESLLHGLQAVPSLIDLSEEISGAPVEGFYLFSPSNVTSLATSEDVPVVPEREPEPPQAVVETPPELEKATEVKPQTARVPQRSRLFRRR